MNGLAYTYVSSPLGRILLVAQEGALTGLYLQTQPQPDLTNAVCQDNLSLFRQAAEWLQAYFAGENPESNALPLSPAGTPFQQEIWTMLQQIPYGKTVTYGELARRYAAFHGTRPCSRAAGGAVGHNPIALLIPCHRVVGAHGALGGYAGGLAAKRFLLTLENPAIPGISSSPYTTKGDFPACQK